MNNTTTKLNARAIYASRIAAGWSHMNAREYVLNAVMADLHEYAATFEDRHPAEAGRDLLRAQLLKQDNDNLAARNARAAR